MINVPNTKLFGQMCLDNFIYDPIDEGFDALAEFFRLADLDAQRQLLARWKSVVTSSDYFEINTFHNPLHEHKMMCNLLNATWLISQNPLVANKFVGLNEEEIDSALDCECFRSSCYPEHLDKQERVDPYLGIKGFFKKYTLQSCHKTLYEWLNFALSPNSQIKDEAAALKFYQNFLKLIECCWLIQFREELGTAAGQQEVSECSIEGEEIIPENLMDSFRQFLAAVPANRLNRGLRKMLIDYLQYNINGLPIDFEELLADFYWLTELLDEIQGKQIDERFK